MLPRNHPDRIQITFDDRRLVANAGLLLPATLARHLGLPELVRQRLDLGDAPGRANTSDKMMTLVASALAGGDCIERTGPVRDCLPLHTVPPTPPQRRCPGQPSAPPTTTKGRHRPHLSESSADRRVPRPSPLVLTPRPLRIGGFGLRLAAACPVDVQVLPSVKCGLEKSPGTDSNAPWRSWWQGIIGSQATSQRRCHLPSTLAHSKRLQLSIGVAVPRFTELPTTSRR